MEEIKINQKMISISELFSQSFKIYEGKFWKLMGMAILPCLISMIPLVIIFILYAIFRFLVPDVMAMNIITMILGFLGVIAVIFVAIINYLAQIGLMIMVKENNPSLKITEAFKMAKKIAWNYLSTGLLAALLILLGFILLLVPGIIWSVYYVFVAWIVISEGKLNKAAMSRSKYLVKGYWWSIFGRLLLLTVILGIISSIPSAQIISWILAPFSAAYVYYMYKSLVAIKDQGEVK
jgi:hypothetical protein